MRTILVDVTVLTSAALLGLAGAAWAPVPVVPGAPAPRVPPPAPLLLPDVPPPPPVDCSSPETPDWPEIEVQLEARLDALEEHGRSTGALPWPWPVDPEPTLTHEHLTGELDRLRAEDPAWRDWHATVECTEYPCMLLLEPDYTDLDLPDLPTLGDGVAAGYLSGPGGTHVIRPTPGEAEPGLLLRMDVRSERLLESSR